MEIQTERLILTPSHVDDVEKIVEYYTRNKSFLNAFEPERDGYFYTRAYQKMLIQASVDAMAQGSELRYWLCLKGEPSKFIGTIAFTNMIMGPFKSCFLGYKLDEAHLRQGYMFEALTATLELIFDAFGLHRVEANIMPRNIPSIELVKKLGFYEEGRAIKYLQINGVWEDHIHMVKRNIFLELDGDL